MKVKLTAMNRVRIYSFSRDSFLHLYFHKEKKNIDCNQQLSTILKHIYIQGSIDPQWKERKKKIKTATNRSSNQGTHQTTPRTCQLSFPLGCVCSEQCRFYYGDIYPLVVWEYWLWWLLITITTRVYTFGATAPRAKIHFFFSSWLSFLKIYFVRRKWMRTLIMSVWAIKIFVFSDAKKK